jgi:hypothetical protein
VFLLGSEARAVAFQGWRQGRQLGRDLHLAGTVQHDARGMHEQALPAAMSLRSLDAQRNDDVDRFLDGELLALRPASLHFRAKRLRWL